MGYMAIHAIPVLSMPSMPSQCCARILDDACCPPTLLRMPSMPCCHPSIPPTLLSVVSSACTPGRPNPSCDLCMHPCWQVSAEADILVHERTEEDLLLMLACDGIFEVYDNNDFARLMTHEIGKCHSRDLGKVPHVLSRAGGRHTTPWSTV